MLPSAPRKHRKKHSLVLNRLEVVSSKSIRNFLIQNTKEFCMKTTLHGLKYITDPQLYLMERIFFGFSFGIVFLLSGYFILNVYENWCNNPVIVGMNPKPTLITSEPFPAVTICNLNQASKSKMENFLPDSIEYALIDMLCLREVNTSMDESKIDWNNLQKFIAEISTSCEDMILKCLFGAIPFNCSELFRAIITDEGLCCAFNMLDPKFMLTSDHQKDYIKNTYPPGHVPVDWSTEHGYPELLPEKYVPVPTVGSGETLGLNLMLDVQTDNYYCSTSNGVGFKILIHNPIEKPNMREMGLLLSPGRETKIRVSTQKMESERGVRRIDKKSRHCLFQDETQLLYFAHYTQRNCEMECEAVMSLELCGCISYHLPRVIAGAPICSIYNTSCTEQIHLRAILTSDGGNGGCHRCLPSCNDMTYYPDFFTTRLRFASNKSSQFLSEVSQQYLERNIAFVNIYFKENSYRSNKQTEYIGFTDFIASVGGLMGLFLGFSIISVVECLYYAIIRPSRSLYQQIQNKKQGRPANGKNSIVGSPPEIKLYLSDFNMGHSRIWLAEKHELKPKPFRNQLFRRSYKPSNEQDNPKAIIPRRDVW